MTAADPRPEPVARYNPVAMTLHWVVALVVILAIIAGLAGAFVDESHARPYVDFHKSLGLTALGLVVLRILWRIGHTPPPMPRSYGRFDRRAAHAAHALLYALMLALPLTGYIHDSAWKEAAKHPIVIFGLTTFPRIGFIQSLDFATREQVHDIFFGAHVWLGYALYALLALHLIGVVKHHAVDHEAELQRMLPGGSRRSPS